MEQRNGELRALLRMPEIALDAAFSDGFSRPDEDDSFVIIEDTTDYECDEHMYSLLSRKPQEESEDEE